jgi:tetratricopeptide (TPR) repeat protein
MLRWILMSLLFITSASCLAQSDEAARADALMQQGRRVEALPLYEHLAREYPNVMLYAEKLADCYSIMTTQTNDPAEIKKYRTLARDEAKRAIALGDTLVYIQQIAEADPNQPLYSWIQSTGEALALLKEAEKAYSAGDFTTAMQKYTASAAADPNLYEAPLYAGDTAYVMKDLPTAAVWFAKAIAIDPNRETAYRYWGDAIFKYGNDPIAAREKFLQAVVAEPYSRYSWQGLEQWAEIQNVIVKPPEIERPQGPIEDPKNPKNVTINIDALKTDDSKNPGGSAWTMYSIIRASYRGDLFSKEFPNEKQYRHSLKEESTALRAVATTIQGKNLKPDQLDESLRNLVALTDAGMLDCWILINGADDGIKHDYEIYRKDHRQLLHDYLVRFVLHAQ